MFFITPFILLVMLHCLADYPLQGDFVSKYKSSQSGVSFWPYILVSHGMIHGLMVYLVLGDIRLALAEAFMHCVIDHAKCNFKLSFEQDQWLHIVCKAVWVGLSFVI